jgi:hypothetical protein
MGITQGSTSKRIRLIVLGAVRKDGQCIANQGMCHKPVLCVARMDNGKEVELCLEHAAELTDLLDYAGD